MRRISYREAIREALAEEMDRDPDVVLIGEDIGCYGGCFKVTSGLFDRFFPDQIIETPVSEECIAGAAVGAAMMGMKPVMEIMYGDFSTLASDALINHAAKMHFMTGGQFSVPLVYRTPMGSGTGAAAQHTQSLETLFTNIPGLKVVYPATPSDAKGLLKSAIRDPGPVVFLEHKLYGIEDEVSVDDFLVPIGSAAIARQGDDVTLIAYGKCVHTALEAARLLEEEGISAEVVDLRSLKPLDVGTLTRSTMHTGRVVIIHEAPLFGGFSGEIAATLAGDPQIFRALKAPIARVCGLEMPIPFNRHLEIAASPSPENIAAAVHGLY